METAVFRYYESDGGTFKSYYVVWKPHKKSSIDSNRYGLNRTM